MYVSLSRYNSLVTGQRAQGIIAICWVLSIIIGLTPMMGWHKRSENTTCSNSNSTCSPGLMECLFEDVVVMEYMVYFNFFACVLIPLLLMLAIYLCIFMAARHQLRLMEVKAAHGESSRSTLQKEVQAAKSLAIIVGLFAVCWLPLHIINCFTLFCPKCDRPPVGIMYVAIILSHGNSVVNPFIYAYRIRTFRQTFRRIIRHHILRQQELPENGNSMFTSIHNSITDSILILRRNLDFFTEHSSSGFESSYHHPTHISSVGGGLVAVAHLPLSVVISHCPQMGPCPLQALRQTSIPRGHHLQYAEQQHDCTGPDIMEDKDKQDLVSAQVTALLNKENRKSSFSELAMMS